VRLFDILNPNIILKINKGFFITAFDMPERLDSKAFISGAWCLYYSGFTV